MCEKMDPEGQYKPSEYARGYRDGWEGAVKEYEIEEDYSNLENDEDDMVYGDEFDDDTEEYDGEIYEGEALDEVFTSDQYPPDDEGDTLHSNFMIVSVYIMFAVLAASIVGAS